MTQTQSNDQRQLKYNWERIGSEQWVNRYEDYLGDLEQYIPTQDAFRRIVELDRERKRLQMSQDLSKKAIAAAATWLVIQDTTPWISPTDISLLTGKRKYDIRKAAKNLSAAYDFENDTPEKVLERMQPKFTDEELAAVREALADLPDKYPESVHRFQAVAVAISRALDVDHEEVCQEYLGGNIQEFALKGALNDLKPREERLAQLEERFDVTLRDDLNQLSVEAFWVALCLEHDRPVGRTHCPPSMLIEGLEDAGIVEEVDDEVTLTGSVTEEG